MGLLSLGMSVFAVSLITSTLLLTPLQVLAAPQDRHQLAELHTYPSRCLNQSCPAGAVAGVSYPFSLSTDCPVFDTRYFQLNCSPEGQLILVNAEVLNITPDSVILRMTNPSTYDPDICTDAPATLTSPPTYVAFTEDWPFAIAADNQLFSFGCRTGVLLTSARDAPNSTSLKGNVLQVAGCEPLCSVNSDNQFLTQAPESIASCGLPNSSASCCLSPFPSAAHLVYYYLGAGTSNHSNVCSAFSVAFHPAFSSSRFLGPDSTLFALRVLWALPHPQLTVASMANNHSVIDLNSTVCSAYSIVIIVKEVPGYRCSCMAGFQGDGYAQGKGCTDIDECASPSLNACLHTDATCRNTLGSYRCHCKSRWDQGDGKSTGSGCYTSPIVIKLAKAAGGVLGLAILVLAMVSSRSSIKRRRRRGYFKMHGGYQLQSYMGGQRPVGFFTMQELKEATGNFAENMKLGVGGFGTVYKGVLRDGRVVAIKKTNHIKGDKEQFLNEVAILAQINHRHIVRLYGCCLETPDPLLVFEFVSKGNLSENMRSPCPVMWTKRLQIATQVADALAYLHSAASPAILHRDVKTANILLDDNLDAKLADFGVSRLIPDGQEHVSTAVRGTIGYLDPEYFQTLQLSEKSDVYSLGVVLVELISGLKAVDMATRDPSLANLALVFIHKMRDRQLDDIIDRRMALDERCGAEASGPSEYRASISEVAKLALQCLTLKGVDRPAMSELAAKLMLINAGCRDSSKLNTDMDWGVESSSIEEQLHGHLAYNMGDIHIERFASHSCSLSSMAPTLPR